MPAAMRVMGVAALAVGTEFGPVVVVMGGPYAPARRPRIARRGHIRGWPRGAMRLRSDQREPAAQINGASRSDQPEACRLGHRRCARGAPELRADVRHVAVHG